MLYTFTFSIVWAQSPFYRNLPNAIYRKPARVLLDPRRTAEAYGLASSFCRGKLSFTNFSRENGYQMLTVKTVPTNACKGFKVGSESLLSMIQMCR